MRLPGAMALALRKARRGKRRGGASGDAAQPWPGRDLGFLYTCPGLAPRPCWPRSLRQSPRGIARAIPPGQRQQRGQREQPLRQTSTSGEFLVGDFFFFLAVPSARKKLQRALGKQVRAAGGPVPPRRVLALPRSSQQPLPWPWLLSSGRCCSAPAIRRSKLSVRTVYTANKRVSNTSRSPIGCRRLLYRVVMVKNVELPLEESFPDSTASDAHTRVVPTSLCPQTGGKCQHHGKSR